MSKRIIKEHLQKKLVNELTKIAKEHHAFSCLRQLLSVEVELFVLEAEKAILKNELKKLKELREL